MQHSGMRVNSKVWTCAKNLDQLSYLGMSEPNANAKTYNSAQPKRPILIDFAPWEHDEIARRAAAAGISLRNVVRRALGFPELRQGQRVDIKPVKRTRVAAKKSAKRAKAS